MGPLSPCARLGPEVLDFHFFHSFPARPYRSLLWHFCSEAPALRYNPYHTLAPLEGISTQEEEQ